MRAGIVAVVLGAGLALPAAAAGQSPQVFRFDGGGYDRAAAITTDGAGNSYVAGSAEAKKGASSFVVVKDGARAGGPPATTAHAAAPGVRHVRWRSTARATCTPPARSATARSSARTSTTSS